MRDELTVIDELGWLGRRRLGLLLPGTTALEAAELAGRLPFRPLAETYPIESDADGQSAADGVLGEILYRPPPFWKRSLDMVGALVGIVLLSPLLFGVVLLIKLGSRGPVFYRQQRAGARGRPFEMWKFRTMCSSVDASIHQAHVSQQMQANGTMSKLDHQQPLIPLGKTLRALGLDELPQLVNILRGDMSLVGPRPDVISYADYKPWQRRRFDVLPGITGLWQVNGKNDTTFEEMVRMDTQYAEHRSLQLDLWILLVTIPTVLRQCRLLD